MTGQSEDTIFALSSGALPAAIAIMRVSGPRALDIGVMLGGRALKPKTPQLRILKDPVDGSFLDEALCLFFPGPNSATGEDLLELQCHGSRAVITRLAAILNDQEGLREAEAGEFTRRAFAHGRMDLNQADGLAELLEAENERARKAASDMFGGRFSALVETWQTRLLQLSALVESELDFSDEADVRGGFHDRIVTDSTALGDQITRALAAPDIEALRNGLTIVLAGPPNCGKSTLLNAVAGREAAIVSDIAGTTRDLIEVPLSIGGHSFRLIDSAGLRGDSSDVIEKLGIERASQAIAASDILLWLGAEGEAPKHDHVLEVAAKADSDHFMPKSASAITLSAKNGEGIDILLSQLVSLSETLLPAQDLMALNRRQRDCLHVCVSAIAQLSLHSDPLLIGEELRLAMASLDRLTGRAATEDMLDVLFGRFCIGK